jgi:hypothetical protein
MRHLKDRPIFLILLFALSLSLGAREAHAYVDPGTAGYLYQIIFIAFSGLIAFFAIFKNMIRSFLGSIFGKSSKKE